MDGRSSADTFLEKNREIVCHASAMADQKASIILGSEFIILTIIITGIWVPQYDAATGTVSLQTGAEQIPIWSLTLFFSILVSVAFSLIVLMPKLGPNRRKRVVKRGSLLFFSSIAEMNKDDYINEMKKVLADDELIYETILGDIYNESRVLRYKKYHYLKLSYLTLMVGIILTMIVFSVEHFNIIDLLPKLPL
tara:strand:+ start:27679 stop:28260 length:582 start_codon:yes stop_codon:yes gene_type:complete